MPSRTEQFQSLIAQQPDNELFRFSLAQALIAEGRLAEAVPHLKRCVAKRPDWMVAYIALGKSLMAIDRKTDALPYFESALRLAVEQRHDDPERELRALLVEFRA